jgi:PAS domain S-box-containing protein
MQNQHKEILTNNVPAGLAGDSTEFRLLKSWYLADLRRHSMDISSKLTPAGLINADRACIEKLVLSGAHMVRRTGNFRPPPARTGLLLLCAILCCAVTAIPIVLVASGAATSNSWMSIVVALSLVACFAAGAVLYLLRLHFLPVLDTTAVQLASSSASDISSYAQLAEKIPEIVRSRDEYQASENLIVDASPHLLLCLDPQLRLLAVNRGVWRTLRYPPEELIGVDVAELVLPEDKPKFVDGVAKARNGEPVANLQLRFLSKQKLAVDLALTLDWSDSNKLFFAKCEDISDEKIIERSRLEYISTIGHDIKIPLSSVWIALQMISDQESAGLSEKQKTIITRAENSVERLIGLIDELLEYEQSTQQGHLSLSYSTIVVEELIADAFQTLQSQAEAKHITLNMETENITLSADEDKLLRVIINLVSNALKYSPPSTEVKVRAFRNGDSVEIRVLDQGPGVPDEYRQIIFERYERLPGTQDIEGKGLGLSISKSIVEAHGGFIGVDPGEKGGAAFWLLIPFRALT